MIKVALMIGLLSFTSSSFAQERLNSTVKDVTAEYKALGLLPDFLPTPTPSASPAPTIPSGDITPLPLPTENNDDKITLNHLITLGGKIWDFILSNKPNAEYDVFKTSVVPSGISSWTQLQKWSKPTSKVFRVEFTNMFGQPAGGFDYRITYFHSGCYKNKGKFLGQISVVPTNIHLKTDRTLKMKVELAGVLNFGDEEDPVAGAQIIINWSSPTTTRYEMYSAEYMIYGTGELEDLSNGN